MTDRYIADFRIEGEGLTAGDVDEVKIQLWEVADAFNGSVIVQRRSWPGPLVAAPPSVPADVNLRDRIRRACAEADGFRFEGLEPHDYQKHADKVLAVLLVPVDRAAVLREAADECDTAGAAYTARAQNEHAAGAFALMETFLRKADEAEYVATPCDFVGCEPGGEPCSTHERLMAHGEGDHELCGPECRATNGELRRMADETQQAKVRCTCGGWFPIGHLHADTHQPVAAQADRVLDERVAAAKEQQVEAGESDCRTPETHNWGCGCPTDPPHRGDKVERWLKAQRDAAADYPEAYQVADGLLDRYRLHADTGTLLDQHVCEGQAVGDCDCLEQPAVEARQADTAREGR